MQRGVQASAAKGGLVLQPLHFAAAIFLLVAAGCAAGGPDLAQVDVDPSIVTSSVSAGSVSTDQPSGSVRAAQTQQSDETTIQNAVSSADIEAAASRELAWANVSTGSRGAISALKEFEERGALCRSFTTSRESFEGISLFAGKTCRGASGNWLMRTFQAL